SDDAVRRNDDSNDAPTYEFGRYRGPSTPPPAEARETSRVTPMRRALGPVVLAVAVAVGVIALMMRQKSPSPDVSDVSAPAAQGPVDLLPPGVGTAAHANAAAANSITHTDQPKQAEPVQAAAPPASEPHQLTASPATPPASAGSPAPTGATTGEPSAEATSNPPRDPSTLPTKNAWLYVSAPVSANVFIHGVDAGPTNTWLETACGTRFVRLGRAAGDWLSAGVPTVIRCRSANTIVVPVP